MAKSPLLLVAILLGATALIGCGDGSSGSGGSGNTGGSGGSGGSGGNSGCTEDSQCPAPVNECARATCNAGTCGTENLADGSVTGQGQTAGDCKKQVCNGQGGTRLDDDDTDVEDDMNACTTDACSSGSPTHAPKAGACASGGTVCGDPQGPNAGKCVECNSDAECAAPEVCDPANGTGQCVDPSCADGVTNGTESDEDCGGSCPPCTVGQMCGGALDCASGYCNGGICNPCGETADCPPGNACDSKVDGGTCVSAFPNGMACTVPGDCVSGFCVDNVCCNSECSGTCEACSTATKGQGMNGTCEPVKQGLDIENECAAKAPATCGETGTCSGTAAACAFHGMMTSCAPQSCTGGLLTAPDFCNGSGTCVDSGTMSCGNYNCDGAGFGCLTTCVDDVDCAATAFCNVGMAMCVPKLTNGSACTAAASCASGNCVDGVCCDTACNGACKACNIGATSGTCSNIATGLDPANECAGTYSCNGTGTCQSCGDAMVNGGEACDDGNMVSGDGCENNCTNLPNPYVLCNMTALPITGAGPGAANPSVINIPASATITDVNVSINCNHTWPGDLAFTLSHGGVSRIIIDQPGFPATTYGCEFDNIAVTLDDEGQNAVEAVCNTVPPAISSPPNRIPNNLLNGFDGQNMSGAWNLAVSDAFAAADDGTLTQWCLNISWQ